MIDFAFGQVGNRKTLEQRRVGVNRRPFGPDRRISTGGEPMILIPP